jgi:hypothetical protein
MILTTYVTIVLLALAVLATACQSMDILYIDIKNAGNVSACQFTRILGISLPLVWTAETFQTAHRQYVPKV